MMQMRSNVAADIDKETSTGGIIVAENNQQNNQQNAPAEDVGRLRQVRRDKLSELQAQGRDPFQIVKYDQTHHTQ